MGEGSAPNCYSVGAKAKTGRKKEYEDQWDPLLVACVDVAIEKTNWDTYQIELYTQPFSLVHKEFHPANMLIVGVGKRLKLVGWEMVRVGSGPQELGQFMISHLEPTVRTSISINQDAVAAYYDNVKNANGSKDLTFDQCWEEYLMGGIGRWLFFLPYDGLQLVNYFLI